jgi:hypothetical protein
MSHKELNPGSVNLRKLDFSPKVNPLVQPQEITLRKSTVRAGRSDNLVNQQTGEVEAISTIYKVVEKDDAEFVKVFAAGVAASYDLTKTAQRVFTAVLKIYEETPMRGGYVDFIDLYWFDGGLCGQGIDMSEKTFQRGLKELLVKSFLAPRLHNSYWINPSLFFKGDRVRFIREYVRKAKEKDAKQTDMLEDVPDSE